MKIKDEEKDVMKRVLTIQDISCLGKCSLTIALPVISALGAVLTGNNLIISLLIKQSFGLMRDGYSETRAEDSKGSMWLVREVF